MCLIYIHLTKPVNVATVWAVPLLTWVLILYFYNFHPLMSFHISGLISDALLSTFTAQTQVSVNVQVIKPCFLSGQSLLTDKTLFTNYVHHNYFFFYLHILKIVYSKEIVLNSPMCYTLSIWNLCILAFTESLFQSLCTEPLESSNAESQNREIFTSVDYLCCEAQPSPNTVQLFSGRRRRPWAGTWRCWLHLRKKVTLYYPGQEPCLNFFFF